MSAAGTTLAYCPTCLTTTLHRHLHDTAHGIAETHMVGSERYECTTCHRSIRKADPEAKPLKFVLD